MATNSRTKREYRARGHKLNPVVTVSDKGVTEAVVKETLRALNDHELIKVRFSVADRGSKDALIDSLCTKCDAELIQKTGKVALLLKPAPQPNPALSNLLRQ
ncbi:MAG: YhbY family RNA-binding protein [Kistimonas sp.]|nr:YhbY family RNA-binding protein [Kistimonas sp.]